MEGGQDFIRKCRMGINSYFLALHQSGPFDVSDEICTTEEVNLKGHWLGPVAVNYESESLCICDRVALKRLQSVLLKVQIISKGVALPHVNTHSGARAVQWIFFNESEVTKYADVSEQYWSIWFTIPKDALSFFNQLVSTCYLSLGQSAITMKNHETQGGQTEKLLCISEQIINLKMLFVGCGNLILSVGDNTTVSPNHKILVVVSHHMNPEWKPCETKNTNLLMMADIQLHFLLGTLPSSLEHVVDVLELREKRSHTIPGVCTLLGPDISVKDEPLLVKEEELSDLELEVEQKAPTLLSGMLLHCPKCPSSFRVGTRKSGIEAMLGHAVKKHRRLHNYCLISAKKQYSAILRKFK